MAGDAFAEAGFAATSMEDIAVRAGVTRMLIYRYYQSKEDLYRSVLDQVAETLIANLRSLGQVCARDIVQAHFDTAREHPGGYRLLWGPARFDPVVAEHGTAVEQRIRELSMRILEPCVSLSGAELRWAARVVGDVLVDLTSAWLDDRDQLDVEEIVALAADGLEGLWAPWCAVTGRDDGELAARRLPRSPGA